MTRPAKSRPSLRLGANLFHHVDRIYDFSPLWIESRWTIEAVECDLRILRSLGAGMVRYHIHPIDFSIDRYPGAEPEQYRRLVPHALAFAKSLGLATHIDLHSNDFDSVQIPEVLARVKELGPENIDTLQVINEFFYLWKTPSHLDKLENILAAIRDSGFQGNLCFDAGGSVHRQIARTHPRLAAFVKTMLPMHHYTYGREWDDLGIATFLDLLTGETSVDPSTLTPEERKYYTEMKREQFAGFSEELQVLEVNAAGFPFWNAEAQENRASRWKDILRRLAVETRVSTVCHFCFRDKISWREYGFAHSGLLHACGLPRPEAREFREAAFELMPADDILASFRLELTVIDETHLRVVLLNRTAKRQRGGVFFGKNPPVAVDVKPHGQAEIAFSLKTGRPQSGAISHYFATFQPESPQGHGICIGWVAAVRPKRASLRPGVRFAAPRVRYAEGQGPVEKFLRDHQTRLAFVVERPATSEMEMAIRLQDAMAEAWGILPPIHTMRHGAGSVLKDQACILIGYPDENSLSRLAGKLIPAECLPKRDECTISAHRHLWQRKPRGLPDLNHHWMRGAGDLALSPGALLIWAQGFDALRRGVFDLVQHIRPPGNSAAKCAGALDHEAWSGLPLTEPRQFVVTLPPGHYQVTVVAGTHFDRQEYATSWLIAGVTKVLSTRQGIRKWSKRVTHRREKLTLTVRPAHNKPACPAIVRISDAATGTSVFKVYFHPRMRADLDYDNYHQVHENTWLDARQKNANWMEVRADANEETVEAREYGWKRV